MSKRFAVVAALAAALFLAVPPNGTAAEACFPAVKKLIVEHLGVEPEKVTREASLTDDLGADQLDLVEIRMALEERFKIGISDSATLITVGDIVAYLARAGRCTA